jgi:MFS family permease
VTISSIGTGFVLPFGSIYLHVVRGLPIPVVGLVISASALASLVFGAVGGTLVDRLGPRTMMLGGLTLQTLGFLWLGFSLTAAEAAASMVLIGAGVAASTHPSHLFWQQSPTAHSAPWRLHCSTRRPTLGSGSARSSAA